jgi:hypothetical protein
VAPVRYIIYFCHVFPQHGRRTELRVLGRPAGRGLVTGPILHRAFFLWHSSFHWRLGPACCPPYPFVMVFPRAGVGPADGHRKLSSESGGRMIRVGHRGSAIGVRLCQSPSRHRLPVAGTPSRLRVGGNRTDLRSLQIIFPTQAIPACVESESLALALAQKSGHRDSAVQVVCFRVSGVKAPMRRNLGAAASGYILIPSRYHASDALQVTRPGPWPRPTPPPRRPQRRRAGLRPATASPNKIN